MSNGLERETKGPRRLNFLGPGFEGPLKTAVPGAHKQPEQRAGQPQEFQVPAHGHTWRPKLS